MGCWDAADPAQLQPRSPPTRGLCCGAAGCACTCACASQSSMQERIPSQTYSAGKNHPSTLQVLGGGQALVQTQAELIMLRASQSSPPLRSSSAEQAWAPCPASAGTGQAPQPCPQLSLPRLPKKTPISSNMCLYAHLAGTQGWAGTAALQGLVDLWMSDGACDWHWCRYRSAVPSSGGTETPPQTALSSHGWPCVSWGSRVGSAVPGGWQRCGCAAGPHLHAHTYTLLPSKELIALQLDLNHSEALLMGLTMQQRRLMKLGFSSNPGVTFSSPDR